MRKSIVLLSLVSIVAAMSGCAEAGQSLFAYSPRAYPYVPSMAPDIAPNKPDVTAPKDDSK
jgi:hypothetical protein